MSESTVKIIGIKKQPNKNDATRLGTTLYFIRDFDDYSLQNAKVLEGKACDIEFTYSDIQCHPGDEVVLQYGKGFQDKAVLTGVTVVKPTAPDKK